jgi:hypothetical protein
VSNVDIRQAGIAAYRSVKRHRINADGILARHSDPARVRKAAPRKQKTDRNDARLLLQLPQENRFPRIWVPDKA